MKTDLITVNTQKLYSSLFCDDRWQKTIPKVRAKHLKDVARRNGAGEQRKQSKIYLEENKHQRKDDQKKGTKVSGKLCDLVFFSTSSSSAVCTISNIESMEFGLIWLLDRYANMNREKIKCCDCRLSTVNHEHENPITHFIVHIHRFPEYTSSKTHFCYPFSSLSLSLALWLIFSCLSYIKSIQCKLYW